MKSSTLLFAFAFVFLFSCNNQNRSSESSSDANTLQDIKLQNKTEDKIPVDGNAQMADSAATPAPPKTETEKKDWDKKIIKTASIVLEVKNFEAGTKSVRNSVKQFGGYIAQEEQNFSTVKNESILTIKVPVDQFDALLNQIPANNGKVIERKITSEDVTAEYIDTRSRLEAKKQMRLKYLEFLKQSKNMEEVLQVQNEINNIQEEIESASGRIQYLGHQAAYSTINLTLYEPLSDYFSADANPSFWSRMIKAVKTGGIWIADLFIGLLTIWPIILIIAVVILAIKKYKSSGKTTPPDIK